MGLSIGVIGVGRWGQNHVRVLNRLKNEGFCDKLVLCDVNEGRVKRLYKKYDIDKYYTDTSEMFSREDLDGVFIVIPTIYHYNVVIKALDYCNVFVEKPISAKLDEALKIIRKTEKLDRVVAVGHIERFNPSVSELKKYFEKVLDGDKIIYIFGQRIGPGPFGGRVDNLGVAHDLMIHDVDIIKYLTNSLPNIVQAFTFKNKSFPYEVDINSFYVYDSFTASLRASWRCDSNLKKRYLFIQTYKSIIEVDYILQTIVIERGLYKHVSTGSYIDILSAYSSKDRIERRLLSGFQSEPLYLEDKHFLECIMNNRKPIVDAVEGYIALKCVVKALESSLKNKPITIEWNEI